MPVHVTAEGTVAARNNMTHNQRSTKRFPFWLPTTNEFNWGEVNRTEMNLTEVKYTELE